MPEVDLDFIRKRKEELGLSNSYMAKQLGLRSREKYYRREHGEYNFQAIEIPVLAKVLQVPMDKIFKPNFSKTKK